MDKGLSCKALLPVINNNQLVLGSCLRQPHLNSISIYYFVNFIIIIIIFTYCWVNPIAGCNYSTGAVLEAVTDALLTQYTYNFRSTMLQPTANNVPVRCSQAGST